MYEKKYKKDVQESYRDAMYKNDLQNAFANGYIQQNAQMDGKNKMCKMIYTLGCTDGCTERCIDIQINAQNRIARKGMNEKQ